MDRAKRILSGGWGGTALENFTDGEYPIATHTTAQAGTVTSGGGLLKRTGKALAGALTPAGALTALRTAYTVLAGTLTSAGALVRLTGKLKAGTLTTAGTLARETLKTLAGAITPAGALTALKTIYRAHAGTLTSSGTLATLRTAYTTLAGTLTSGGTLTKRTSKTLAGTLTTAGTLARRTTKRIAGTLTTAGALATYYIIKPVASALFTLPDARKGTITSTVTSVAIFTLAAARNTLTLAKRTIGFTVKDRDSR